MLTVVVVVVWVVLMMQVEMTFEIYCQRVVAQHTWQQTRFRSI